MLLDGVIVVETQGMIETLLSRQFGSLTSNGGWSEQADRLSSPQRSLKTAKHMRRRGSSSHQWPSEALSTKPCGTMTLNSVLALRRLGVYQRTRAHLLAFLMTTQMQAQVQASFGHQQAPGHASCQSW